MPREIWLGSGRPPRIIQCLVWEVLVAGQEGRQEGRREALQEGHREVFQEDHREDRREDHRETLQEGHQEVFQEGRREDHREALQEGHQEALDREEARQLVLPDGLLAGLWAVVLRGNPCPCLQA